MNIAVYGHRCNRTVGSSDYGLLHGRFAHFSGPEYARNG